eukprot:TRINITY_DN1298_c0_g1_i10.p1 TRINITY_DN1298_c0_g1~~TRINITY_DN1298_c0_g1_i10.p1  ORF type:complete len:355 (+),score=59.40 TRINITY_DN1298_c0_g1_i10:25-1065(+)
MSADENFKTSLEEMTQLLRQAETLSFVPPAVKHSRPPKYPRCPWFPQARHKMVALAVITLHKFGIQVSQQQLERVLLHDPMDLMQWFHNSLPSRRKLARQIKRDPSLFVFMRHLETACDDLFFDYLLDLVKPSFHTFSTLHSDLIRLFCGCSFLERCTVIGALVYRIAAWHYDPESERLPEKVLDEASANVHRLMSIALDRTHITESTEELGRGGSAVVVKGSYCGQPVAIKKLLQQPSVRDMILPGRRNAKQLVMTALHEWQHKNGYHRAHNRQHMQTHATHTHSPTHPHTHPHTHTNTHPKPSTLARTHTLHTAHYTTHNTQHTTHNTTHNTQYATQHTTHNAI